MESQQWILRYATVVLKQRNVLLYRKRTRKDHLNIFISVDQNTRWKGYDINESIGLQKHFFSEGLIFVRNFSQGAKNLRNKNGILKKKNEISGISRNFWEFRRISRNFKSKNGISEISKKNRI
jgi:hypothetical protein